jgi:hypothetical protein
MMWRRISVLWGMGMLLSLLQMMGELFSQHSGEQDLIIEVCRFCTTTIGWDYGFRQAIRGEDESSYFSR